MNKINPSRWFIEFKQEFHQFLQRPGFGEPDEQVTEFLDAVLVIELRERVVQWELGDVVSKQEENLPYLSLIVLTILFILVNYWMIWVY